MKTRLLKDVEGEKIPMSSTSPWSIYLPKLKKKMPSLQEALGRSEKMYKVMFPSRNGLVID